MARQTAVNSLFILWITIGGILIILISMQMSFAKYGDDSMSAWAWLLNQLIPPLSLISAAFFSEAKPAWKNGRSNTFRWVLAFFFSVVQGGGVLAILLAEPYSQQSSFYLFDQLGVGIAVVQGTAIAAISTVIFDGR